MMLAVLREWLGSGGTPVKIEVAEVRSKICPKCPHNIRGNWFDRLKREAADIIRRHLAAKAGLNLSVSNEYELGFCEKCGCCLSLKVWTPSEHIGNNTDPHELLEYPDFCWVRKELTGR